MLSVFTVLTSCSDDITGLNQDTKNPVAVPAEFLFTNAEKNLVDQMVNTNVNNNVFRLFAQQLTETTYTDETNYDITTRTIPDNHFRILYRDVLKDLVESKKILSQETSVSPEQTAILNNKNAQIDILIAYTYYVLVDTFGNIPYTEALDIEKFPNPKYDDALTIYKDLIVKLTASSAALNASFGSFGSNDIIYDGDINGWKKFANSLRLKLAINLHDLDPSYASTQAVSAVNDGVFTSNSDNASLQYLSVQPNTNPLFVDLVASGRDDFVPANTLVDKMNSLNDPRRAEFFTQFGGGYVGGTYGTSNNFANFSHIGTKLLNPTFEGLLLDYTEIEFLLAEAVERGINVGGTASSHYNNAITASLNYWNISATDAATYLAQPSVAYATANGTWQQKIGEQVWIGLYNRGFEAWTSYRRLDFPVLLAPVSADITEVPKRYTYPAAEETLNAANSAAASAAIGGNTLTTKLFWDKF